MTEEGKGHISGVFDNPIRQVFYQKIYFRVMRLFRGRTTPWQLKLNPFTGGFAGHRQWVINVTWRAGEGKEE